jgi:hypothetical protein
MIGDDVHLPLALGVAAAASMLNAGVLWLIAGSFQGKVEAIVARHTTSLVATMLARYETAERTADDAKRAAFTVNAALHALELRHAALEARVVRLEGPA